MPGWRRTVRDPIGLNWTLPTTCFPNRIISLLGLVETTAMSARYPAFSWVVANTRRLWEWTCTLKQTMPDFGQIWIKG